MIRRLDLVACATFFFSLLAALLCAQEMPAQTAVKEEPPVLKLREFESLTVNALRREFPRLPGIFSSSSSCRLPEYGPMVSVTLQLPAYYFTRPVLLELERRQRAAEEQARKIRLQIDRAAQLINLRAREAALEDRIDKERSGKKKSESLEALENDLVEVRKALRSLDTTATETVSVKTTEQETMSEVDLNKMIVANYQQMLQRVTAAMKNHLAENGPRIDLHDAERVSINAQVRDNFLPNQNKSIVFVLDAKDISDFKEGRIDFSALKEKVLVRHQDKD
jgi:hypothetical protein